MDDLEAEHLARLKRLGHTYTLNLIMELKQKVEQLEAEKAALQELVGTYQDALEATGER